MMKSRGRKTTPRRRATLPHSVGEVVLPGAEKAISAIAERMPITEQLLTPEDVAALLQVTVRTVERWQQEGVLVFLRMGHTIRFHWPSVVNHLLSNFMVNKGSLRTATTQNLKR
jgi:excisionase family DNA binding protein